ncbi:pilin [Photobacterium damselae]
MKGQKGFTLIELMIVVAVIGVLSAIAVPAYQNYVKKSELGAALATLSALKVNVEDKIATNGSFPTVTSGSMSTELGASTSHLGSLSTEQDNSASAAGNILFTFTANSQNSSEKIALNRNSSGTWSCKTTVDTAAQLPKGCITDSNL